MENIDIVIEKKGLNGVRAASQTVKTFTIMNSIIDWIKGNKLMAGLGALVIILLFFPRVLRGIFGSPAHRHRRHVRRAITGTTRRRRRRPVMRPAVRRRSSVSRRRSGSKKKPWQIKGSLAARRHMAQIRRRR